jgi:hypothetical protein
VHLRVCQLPFFQILLKNLPQGFYLTHRLWWQLAQQFEDIGSALTDGWRLRECETAKSQTEDEG